MTLSATTNATTQAEDVGGREAAADEPPTVASPRNHTLESGAALFGRPGYDFADEGLDAHAGRPSRHEQERPACRPSDH